MDGAAGMEGEVAVAGEGGEAVDEVHWRSGDGQWIPAELAWRSLCFVEGRGANHAVGDALIGLVHDGGSDAISPGAAVLVTRRGEWCATELFRIEAEWGFLGSILADGERARMGLGGKLISETREVTKLGHGDLVFVRYGV